MMKWTPKPAVNKTYTNTVVFFNERETEIEGFEASSANTTNQHGFVSANSMRGLAIDTLLEQPVKRDKEKAASVIEVNNKI
jgi:hypothetical protein